MKYQITMKTPIGLRFGTMNLHLVESGIKGTLELLGQQLPIHGFVNEHGICTIYGELITLKRCVEYIAIGKITERSLDLLMKEERNVFKITGVAINESEVWKL